jgi:hypothetical protein
MISVNKKGQVTVFLIIGLVLLMVFASVFYMISLIQEESLFSEYDTSGLELRSSVSFYVGSCLDDLTTEATFLSAYYGGIIYPENDSEILLTEYSMVNYGYLDGELGISVSKTESDISQYIEKYLPSCLGSFSEFEIQGILIDYDSNEISVKSHLKESYIQIELELPLTITTANGNIVEMEDFFTDVDVMLGDMLNVAEEISIQNSESLMINNLLHYNYYVAAFPYDEHTTIYSLTDENNLIDDAPLTLMFAVENNEINHAPELSHIPNIAIQEGEQWYYRLYATDDDNDKLSFYSDSVDFTISSGGVINMTMDGIGSYLVTYTVRDEDGLEDQQEVEINIIESLDNETQEEPDESGESTLNEI